MADKDATDEHHSGNSKDVPTGRKKDRSVEETWTEGAKLPRRSLLKLTGAAATTTFAAAGLGGSASAAVSYNGISFDRVLDAVEDLGMDPNGNEPIDDAFNSALETGTLIEFPAGTYLMDTHHSTADVSRFGVRGLGDTRRDVQFRPTDGSAVAFLHGGGPGPFMIENVCFDELSDDVSMVYCGLGSKNGCYVGNVEWLGRTPLDDASDYTLNVDVYDQDAVSVFENIYVGLDEPAVEATYPDGVAFFRAGPSHEGEVVLRNPVIHERNSAATRLEAGPGVTTIEGGEFVNNQNANIRFGAGDHPSKVSSATGTYVKVDGSRDSADAIRLGADSSGYAGAVFEDLTIEWTKDSGRGVIALPDFGDHGRAEFYNCVVRNDGENTRTINADSVDIADDEIIVENCAFTGSGRGFDAADRDGSVIRDSCVDMPNASFSGFATENISTDSCRVPGEESGSTNDEPTASITVTDTRDLTVDFSGAESSDPDGSITSYQWDVAGTSYTGETVTHTFDADGTYTVSLTVEDDAGATATTTKDVTVDDLDDLQIVGTGTPTEYSFEVDGTLEPVSDTLEDWDEVTETGATGWVTETEDVDEFRMSGSFTTFEFLQGEADVYRNGELIEPTVSELSIQGTGQTTEYAIEVSERLYPVEDTIEPWDDVSETSATGWVTSSGDTDKFTFEGDLTRVEFLRGEADVYVDGSQIDPSQY